MLLYRSPTMSRRHRRELAKHQLGTTAAMATEHLLFPGFEGGILLRLREEQLSSSSAFT
jgi:hypothetical protein